jgi:hypothetical protein
LIVLVCELGTHSELLPWLLLLPPAVNFCCQLDVLPLAGVDVINYSVGVVSSCLTFSKKQLNVLHFITSASM